LANPIAYKHYNDVWIMPSPGDSGSAIGAVLANKKKHISWKGPYLGYDIGYQSKNEDIVEHLINHKICGIARGKAEFGPRALGNRSLIADPREHNIKELVNNIKKRQQFRPFSPVILEEFVEQYFDMPTKTSPYMQYAVKCKNPNLYPGIVHVDGTSRVQTINSSDNLEFYKLLKLWYSYTGCPLLLNTSLNIRGFPMVNNFDDSKLWETQYKIKVFN
jgi:carbamoyltransferase